MYRKTTSSTGRRAQDQNDSGDLEQFDALTGLANRDFYQSRIAEAWEQAVKDKTLMSLSLLALDGVSRGDQVDDALGDQLKVIAEVLSAQCQRRADFAARMRATEFAIYLAEVDAAGAAQRGENICQAIHQQTGMTVSIGMACFQPTQRRFVRSIYQYADQALRKAQAEGGNAVRMMTEADF